MEPCSTPRERPLLVTLPHCILSCMSSLLPPLPADLRGAACCLRSKSAHACVSMSPHVHGILISFSIFRDHFDSPSFTTLGADKVIPGLEKGLRGMCVGERREVVVPPHWGHGENGAGGVPRSAVLFFQLELVELQKGVPEGFMFVWLGDGPDALFPAMDLNGDKEVPLEEFSAFIRLQVEEGKGRLRPGVDPDSIIRDMFNNQDQNKDGKVTEDELSPREDDKAEKTGRDEL